MIQDKVLLEILRNRFQAIADEMASVAYRTAHTVFVKETQDFATALVTPGGEIFAAPRRYGVLIMLATPMDGAIRAIGDDVREGDVFMSNDPVATEGMCTHLTDVYFWKPIFDHGTLVCYAWSFIHSSDVGGKVPGSISPSNYEIYQEGIRIPPRKLFYEGKLDEPFLRVFLNNCRIPEPELGRHQSLPGQPEHRRAPRPHAAGAVRPYRRRRRHGVGARLGRDAGATRDPAACRMASTPTSTTWRATSWISAWCGSASTCTCGVTSSCSTTPGTDPQVRASLNMYSYSKTGHWNIIIGLIHWLCTDAAGDHRTTRAWCDPSRSTFRAGHC